MLILLHPLLVRYYNDKICLQTGKTTKNLHKHNPTSFLYFTFVFFPEIFTTLRQRVFNIAHAHFLNM